MDSVFREGLLAGRVALITGGGTGIGFGIATALAKLGCDIVLVSRRSTHLDPAARSLLELGVRALPCLLYTSPSPRDLSTSRMPSSA